MRAVSGAGRKQTQEAPPNSGGSEPAVGSSPAESQTLPSKAWHSRRSDQRRPLRTTRAGARGPAPSASENVGTRKPNNKSAAKQTNNLHFSRRQLGTLVVAKSDAPPPLLPAGFFQQQQPRVKPIHKEPASDTSFHTSRISPFFDSTPASCATIPTAPGPPDPRPHFLLSFTT